MPSRALMSEQSLTRRARRFGICSGNGITSGATGFLWFRSLFGNGICSVGCIRIETRVGGKNAGGYFPIVLK